MTSTYGRAGGPTTQMVRETADATTASVLTTSANGTTTQVILAAATGDDYYLIWGFTVGTSNTNPEFGYLESTDGAEDISAFAVTAAGPLSSHLSMPIRLAPLQGVNITMLKTVDSTKKVLPMIYYTLVSP
tara:strand:- start:51 stop:443 length:393 start_codon:yes stop_codon:yes gene_type:complete